MDDKFLCETNRVVVLPCSSGSNCGRIANAVAVELTKEGHSGPRGDRYHIVWRRG